MLANKRRDTEPELAVRRLLHARGLRYRVDARPVPEIRSRADVVFSRWQVAVFIDGCYWHGCPEHYQPSKSNTDYWLPKIERNAARDREVDAKLISAGWTVVRAWEHEAAAAVADRVEATVRAARRP